MRDTIIMREWIINKAKEKRMTMSDYIDETSLTDEEVAAAIAAAKAKKAERARLAKEAEKSSKPTLEKTKSLDEASSDNLLNESSSAAQLEEEENESPAVRSAKSFSNAFAAAKKKREQDLLKKKEERQTEKEDEPEDSEEPDEKEEDASAAAVAAAVVTADDDEGDAEFEVDSEEEEAEIDDHDDDYDEDDEYDDDEDDDDEEYDEDDDEDEDFDSDGIFETDDENGEYNTTVNVDEDDEDEDDDEDDEYDEDDEDDSTFSTKTKVIIGIVIAVLVIAIIAAVAFFMKNSGDGKDTSSVASAVEGDVTSVKFAEPSVSLEVGETIDLKLIVEPENATDKTFKLKSNDENIVKVNEKGQITGIASGSTTVTATLKSNPTMTASLVVNVIDEEQSTLNIYNKFINSILEETTDIDPDSETDTEASDEENNEEDSDTETDKSSDSDSEKDKPKKAKRVLSGNKIDDFDSDGELELALYYEPSTDNEEPLVRIFQLVDEDAEPQTDSEEEVQEYDEFGNPIKKETDSEKPADTASDKPAAGAKKSPKDMTLMEVEQFSEAYMGMHTTLEADAATKPWNTSYLEVKESETATPRVTILSSGYKTPTYTFESEDQEIATVDKQGNIKGIKPGTVFITVSSPLNSDAVAKVKVRVKDDTDLLDDYLADIPVVNNTNDTIFPTETLIGKAIVDIDNDGVSELLLRFRYSDSVEAINMIKVENEKCVCYKTYNNLSDLYEYNEGNGSYSNSILIHYTTGKVCMEYKAVVAKSGSKSKSSEEKILTIESGGSLSELVNFRTTTDISTKTVTSEASERVSSREDDDDERDNTSSETVSGDTDTEEQNNDTSSTASYVDEDEDGYDDITGEYFGSYAAFTFDEIEAAAAGNGIDMTSKTPVKLLPQLSGAPEDEDEDEDEDYDNTTSEEERDRNDEETTSTVTTEVAEETTKYFVNGTPVDQSVYEETLTRYSATYSVWNAWESVY